MGNEILRCAQDDKRGIAQDDKQEGIARVTSGNILALPVRGSQGESCHAECNEASRHSQRDSSLRSE